MLQEPARQVAARPAIYRKSDAQAPGQRKECQTIMSAIASNLQVVRERINTALAASGRAPGSARLIAVSKMFAADAVVEACSAGQTVFGENYVQEALEKIRTVNRQLPSNERLEWHMIGPLQSNKTRIIAEHFDWVHTIDRIKIAERLSEQRPGHLRPLKVCLQVNISGEASKSGVAPEQLGALARAVNALPGLQLQGLMTIPEPADDVATQRQPFAALRRLSEQLCAQGLPCGQLSMGMSHDLEAAISEGATMVRVGTAIFGTRTARPA